MRTTAAFAILLNLLAAAAAAAAQFAAPVPLTEAERAIRTQKFAFLRAALSRESPVEPERLGEE